ncbi:hypothetical protein THIOM_001491 [Candidatus Thiomargarita nelsonii]|uniref:Uncharacterized protein n=1 Tax=Candidatus Thiomargarita nelsonii TaxID=1003181 RepID=A0A176S3Q2_9GAMM|nr:hypothetical protein THIOM_001491 [Candidatus Thiomargarita nelsonii]
MFFLIRQLTKNNIPRATTRDCPYQIRWYVGAIPCGCPLWYIYFWKLPKLFNMRRNFFRPAGLPNPHRSKIRSARRTLHGKVQGTPCTPELSLSCTTVFFLGTL